MRLCPDIVRDNGLDDAQRSLFVTKAGGCDLSADGSPLVPKEAKPLPASD